MARRAPAPAQAPRGHPRDHRLAATKTGAPAGQRARGAPAAGMADPEIALEEFRQFYLAKSYDVIGQGTFRKHLCKCKEAGDPWAVEMNAGVTKVHQAVRGVQARVAHIPKPRNALLQQLCRDVMVGAQPPIRMYAGYTTCCLSGVSCNICIDLTRPAKNAQHVHIHARFSHFFLMLWYCSKLEYVVRSCAKAWLERQDLREGPTSGRCARRSWPRPGRTAPACTRSSPSA